MWNGESALEPGTHPPGGRSPGPNTSASTTDDQHRYRFNALRSSGSARTGGSSSADINRASDTLLDSGLRQRHRHGWAGNTFDSSTYLGKNFWPGAIFNLVTASQQKTYFLPQRI